jgi:nucleotide sugar dehydrogenase
VIWYLGITRGKVSAMAKTVKNKKPLIGFVGQGYVGKNYADDFERRGYKTIRYALEEPYRANKSKIIECDIVFIAVPTPTTLRVFDDSIVRGALALVGKGKIAIVKSTIVPGTTKSFQQQYPDRIVFYSPEFLSEATAAYDASHPFSNVIGTAKKSPRHTAAARKVLKLLPKAPFELVCDSTEAELIKYAHNGSGYVQVVFFNMMYDLAKKLGANWAPVEKALGADIYISNRYSKPVHKSGRGAGGHCFIKDFAALRGLYEKAVGDPAGVAAFSAVEEKNVELLAASGKDADLLAGVYGKR